jgi:hypothetical protein
LATWVVLAPEGAPTPGAVAAQALRALRHPDAGLDEAVHRFVDLLGGVRTDMLRPVESPAELVAALAPTLSR